MVLIHGRCKISAVFIMAATAAAVCGCASTGWQARIRTELPVLGHRNWVVVADSAYPKQSASGIETVYTYAKQMDVLDTVMKEIEAAPHVQAIVFLDAELYSLTEKDAPGIEAYRMKLEERLKGKQVRTMLHEEIIGKLDADAKLFNILLLKTDMVLPYTSVFLQLDCGYWDADKEKRLREAIAAKE